MDVIDLFCGSGGTSTGIVEVPECKVIIAVNHSPEAIRAHKANHPETRHLMEDIRKVKLTQLPICDLIWASIECTHFSGAAGGRSRDADSRSLAWSIIN